MIINLYHFCSCPTFCFENTEKCLSITSELWTCELAYSCFGWKSIPLKSRVQLPFEVQIAPFYYNPFLSLFILWLLILPFIYRLIISACNLVASCFMLYEISFPHAIRNSFPTRYTKFAYVWPVALKKTCGGLWYIELTTSHESHKLLCSLCRVTFLHRRKPTVARGIFNLPLSTFNDVRIPWTVNSRIVTQQHHYSS